ncbi:hypothetical protein [Rubripirellula tenax]|uniref:hypothetical protein n=1 Tax=Rubripirellula tenax TaxID=2528015 RepID=UPI0011B3E281|nr:hypothetical protein [Rubripirellula tenax]
MNLASAAKITPESVEKMQSSEDGKERLKKLRKFAAVSIETTRTWVNLSLALAISRLSTVDTKPEVSLSVKIEDGSNRSWWDDDPRTRSSANATVKD